MAKRKSQAAGIENLSAQELYELARRREQEEYEHERDALKGELEELRAQRRELAAQQKREMAAVDKEIRALKKRIGGAPARSTARGGNNVSQAVLDAIAQAGGQASTKEIKSALDQAGIEAANLGQCLAYLKRKGRIVSPERATYALA